jgi:hypothetical protein
MKQYSVYGRVYGVIASITDIVWFPVIETSSYISPTYTIIEAIEAGLL